MRRSRAARCHPLQRGFERASERGHGLDGVPFIDSTDARTPLPGMTGECDTSVALVAALLPHLRLPYARRERSAQSVNGRDLNAHVARRLVLTPPQLIATPTKATSSVVSLRRLDRIRDAYRLVVFNNILVSVDKKWLSHCEEFTQLLDKVDKKPLVT
jgi:hypothetical protein